MVWELHGTLVQPLKKIGLVPCVRHLVQVCISLVSHSLQIHWPGTDDAKPADVFILHWTHGKDTALDVTVVNPLQELVRSGQPGSH